MILCSVVKHAENEYSICKLCEGTQEECEAVANRIPAIMNKTGKPVLDAYLAIVSKEEFDEVTKDA